MCRYAQKDHISNSPLPLGWGQAPKVVGYELHEMCRSTQKSCSEALLRKVQNIVLLGIECYIQMYTENSCMEPLPLWGVGRR